MTDDVVQGEAKLGQNSVPVDPATQEAAVRADERARIVADVHERYVEEFEVWTAICQGPRADEPTTKALRAFTGMDAWCEALHLVRGCSDENHLTVRSRRG